MFESDEKECSLEEIFNTSKSTKQRNKIVNLRIKQLPEQKEPFKGFRDKSHAQVENNANSSTKPSPPRPSTSTNSTKKQEFASVEEPKENIRIELPISNLSNGTKCPITDQIMSAIEELHDLVKKNSNETRSIRQEILSFANVQPNDNDNDNDDPSFIPIISGPCKTLDEFYSLENKVQEDETARKAFEKLLRKIVDQSLDRYVRFCLKAILDDNVAAQCTWHGKNGNISVHNMATMGVLCDCTRMKFPTASTSVIIRMIKKWFHYAKDRLRRRQQKERLMNFQIIY